MRVAVISDIHDNLANLKTCLDWCRQNNVKKLICCGDLTTLKTVSYLVRNFPGEIFIVAGNAEIYDEAKLAKFKNFKYLGAIGRFEIEEINIGLCHEPAKIIKVQKLAPAKVDFIFYGHTHKPWLEKQENTFIINPGTLGGVFNPATFAVLETDAKKIELKILTEL